MVAKAKIWMVPLALTGGCLVAVSAPARAGHDVFHIFTPVIEQGTIGAEVLSTLQTGKISDGDHSDEGAHDDAADEEQHGHDAVRAAHEFAVHAGVTDFWMAKLALGLERPVEETYALTAVAIENVFRLPGTRLSGFDYGWFTAVSIGIGDDATDSVEFGPVLTVDTGPVALAFNPFLEKTFGRNREDGIAFTYGWRATTEVAEKLSIGLEGYGEIENIGDSPAARDQIHRVGPVIYFGHVHGAAAHDDGHEHEAGGDGPHMEIGVLFGLTAATPDAALKLNVGYDF